MCGIYESEELKMKCLRKYMFDLLAWYLSKKEIRKKMTWCGTDPAKAYQVTKSYVGRGFYSSIHAAQEEVEIINFTKFIKESNPKVVVEIGTKNGGTFFLWLRTCLELRVAVSIDLPGGRYGGGYLPIRKKLYKEFGFQKRGLRVSFIQLDSHSKKTGEQLRFELQDELIDFLFIDGDHTYEGVKQDYYQYKKFVRQGGIIAFHDIVTKTHDCGVYKFWEELKKNNQYKEFVEHGSNKGIGIVVAK